MLGFGTVTEYRAHGDAYFGATIGRYANRIAEGRFTLDDRTCALPRNDRGNCLHGGPLGFDKRTWQRRAEDDGSVTLGYVSADGEMGFPGRMDVEVTYALRGSRSGSTSARRPTLPTHADLDQPHVLEPGRRGCGHSGQCTRPPARTRGFDVHAGRRNWGTDRRGENWSTRSLLLPHRAACGRRCPTSTTTSCWMRPDSGARRSSLIRYGRSLEVWAMDRALPPGVDRTLAAPHGSRSCVALETQHAPDSPNRPQFPQHRFATGEVFASTTFSAWPRRVRVGVVGAADAVGRGGDDAAAITSGVDQAAVTESALGRILHADESDDRATKPPPVMRAASAPASAASSTSRSSSGVDTWKSSRRLCWPALNARPSTPSTSRPDSSAATHSRTRSFLVTTCRRRRASAPPSRRAR